LKRHAARQPRLDDGGVELAAIDEDRGDEIKEHQRDHHGGKPRIHGDVIVGEAREIFSKHDARHQRRHHRENDAGQDLQEAAPSGRQPGMQNEEGGDQRDDGDAVAGQIEELLVALDDQGNVAPHRLDDQWSEYDQEGHRKRGERGNQGVGDRFQPEPVPASWLDHRIGAVESHPQRLDAVGGEVHRQHRANGQDIAARGRQHVVNLTRERVRHLLRPGLQQKSCRLVSQFLRSEETGERGEHDQEWKERHQCR